MKLKPLVGAVIACVLAASFGVAKAVTLVSLVGDMDGFGLGVKNGDGFDFESIGGGDGDGTDVWHDGSLSYLHSYSFIGPIQSASLEVFTGGWGLDGAASLFLNGTLIGHLTDGDNSSGAPPYNFAFKDIFDVTPYRSLLTGHDTFEIRPLDGNNDAGALDYSQFTVVTGAVTVVPEPSTFALSGLGFLALVAARRRRHAGGEVRTCARL